MTRKNSNILLPYENKWVALSRDNKKVIASGRDVKVLTNKLEKMRVKRDQAILTWVFPFKQAFAPSNV